MTLNVLGQRRLSCSALKNANCFSALARVDRAASLRVGILAEDLRGPQNVYGVSKIDFFQNHHSLDGRHFLFALSA